MKLEDTLKIIQTLNSELNSIKLQIKDLDREFSYSDYSYSDSDRFKIKHSTMSMQFNTELITGSDACKHNITIDDSSIAEELIIRAVELLKERQGSIEDELQQLIK